MVYIRRRGTAIVETPKGILLVSKNGRTFLTPGGGARHYESRQDAAIRELREETGLKVVEIAYLFDFEGVVHQGPRGGRFRNAHQVFLARTTGVAEPRREIRSIAYYDGSSSSPRISYSARKIIRRYRSLKGLAPNFVSTKCPADGSPLDVQGSPSQVRCPLDGAVLYRDSKGVYRPASLPPSTAALASVASTPSSRAPDVVT